MNTMFIVNPWQPHTITPPPFSKPNTTPLRHTRKAYTSPWSWRSPLSPPPPPPPLPVVVATYHILKLGLGGVQVERTHNSAKFLGGNATVTVLVKESESFLELCNLLFGKLVSLRKKVKASEQWGAWDWNDEHLEATYHGWCAKDGIRKKKYKGVGTGCT